MRFSASFLVLLCVFGLLGSSNSLIIPMNGAVEDPAYLETRDGPARGSYDTPTVPDGMVQPTVYYILLLEEVNETDATTLTSYDNVSEPAESTIKPPKNDTQADSAVHAYSYQVIYRIMAYALAVILTLGFLKVLLYLHKRSLPRQQARDITRRFKEILDREDQYPYAQAP